MHAINAITTAVAQLLNRHTPDVATSMDAISYDARRTSPAPCARRSTVRCSIAAAPICSTFASGVCAGRCGSSISLTSGDSMRSHAFPTAVSASALWCAQRRPANHALCANNPLRRTLLAGASSPAQYATVGGQPVAANALRLLVHNRLHAVHKRLQAAVARRSTATRTHRCSVQVRNASP